MSETTNQQQPEVEEKPLSEQELKAMRDRMIKYYKEQNSVLKEQAAYETLLADIEEARARRMTMTIRLAQMMAGPPREQAPVPPDPDGQENTQPPAPEGEQRPGRKLKTE